MSAETITFDDSTSLVACPNCNGRHFFISRSGAVVCSSQIAVGIAKEEFGCGWLGVIIAPLQIKPVKPKLNECDPSKL